MLPSDEAALQIWQNNRDLDPVVMGILLDDCFKPEYAAQLDIVRNCMSEEFEMTFEEEDEAALQFALVGFRTMNPEMRIAFLVGAMDEMIEQARSGSVDKYAAEQIHHRAEHVFASVVLPAIKGAA